MNKFLVASLVLIAAWGASAQVPTCQCQPANATGELPCCTFTRGRWGNWNKYAKQPHRQIPWPICAPLSQGEDTVIYGGYTAIQFFDKTAPTNDRCHQLASQFIAAHLNKCQGACTDAAVDTALSEAYALLTSGLCPGGLGNQSPNRSKADSLIGILDGYNMGTEFGPGHCDEENPEECPDNLCEGGCTRTRGYHRTHDSFNEPGCPYTANQILYGSVTWADALSTPPESEACLIAGAQYVASKLNQECLGAQNACSLALVDDAQACVEALLASSCPGLTSPSGLTEDQQIDRMQILQCARTLDQYNNGFDLGPGSCDALEYGNGNGNGGNGKGNGGGPKKAISEVSEDLTTGEADGIAISTLVLAALAVCGIIIVIWIVKRYTDFKMGRRYRTLQEDAEI